MSTLFACEPDNIGLHYMTNAKAYNNKEGSAMIWLVVGLFVGVCCAYNIWRAFVVFVDVILYRFFRSPEEAKEENELRSILLALFLAAPIDFVFACVTEFAQYRIRQRHG